MLINFNVDRLEKLLYDFYRLTGLTVSIWDSNMKMLSHQPKEMSDYCRKIREYPEGARRCYLSDMKLCEECKQTGKPATHVCHAGLADSVVPLKFKDEILGYIMFGQVIPSKKRNSLELIERISRDLGIDNEEMTRLFSSLDSFDEEKINAASNILKMSARYLWLSEYIEIKHDDTAKALKEYIDKNLASDINVDTICRELGISKNRLYKISHESFGMTIGNYINENRIRKAKHLLISGDMPIGKICEAVGIKDYNYFSKYFKAKTGISPRKYRKNYPAEFY